MKLSARTQIAMIAGLVSISDAFAGAWDVGPFDNDDALDFVYELSEKQPYRLLWGTFSPCMQDRDAYIESYDGSRIVAAAALIAANLSNDTRTVPEELHDWVSSMSWASDVKLIGTAEMCINAVANEDNSELAQLWAESDMYEEWAATIRSISTKLTDAPD